MRAQFLILLALVASFTASSAFADNAFKVKPVILTFVIQDIQDLNVPRPVLGVKCDKTTGWWEPTVETAEFQIPFEYTSEKVGLTTTKITIAVTQEAKFKNPFTGKKRTCNVHLTVLVEDQRFDDRVKRKYVGDTEKHEFIHAKVEYVFEGTDKVHKKLGEVGGKLFHAYYARNHQVSENRFEWHLFMKEPHEVIPNIQDWPYWTRQSTAIPGDAEKPDGL